MLAKVFLELIIVIILVFGSYYGYTRGLFRLLITPARFVICLLLSLRLAPIVGRTLFLPIISDPVRNYIGGIIGERFSEIQTMTEEGSIPTVMKIAAAIFNVEIQLSDEMLLDGIMSLADPLVGLIAYALSFLALLLLFTVLLRLIINLCDAILSVGIIGRINKIFGVLVSFFAAIIVAWLFVSAVDVFIISKETDGALPAFVGGPLYRLFKDNSPLKLLLSF